MTRALAVTLAGWPRREAGSGRKPEWRDKLQTPSADTQGNNTNVI